MIRSSRRLLSLATGTRLSPRNPRPSALHSLFSPVAFPTSRGLSSKTNDQTAASHARSDAVDDSSINAMDPDHQTSSGSGTSRADVKSPASESGSVDSFGGSSIFDGIDELSLDLGSEGKEVNTTQDNTPSASEYKPLSDSNFIDLTEENAVPVSESDSAKQDSVESDEEPEAPYTVSFTIPSPPPPVDGVPNDPPLFWTHKLYRGSQDQPVKVHYCTEFNAAETLAKRFLGEKVVGFDMEWEPYSTPTSPIKKQISVIQVAAEAEIAIFHIARFEGGNSTAELIPSSLKTLIESPEIMKTGVAVHSADGTRIVKVLGLNPAGLVELSHLFHMVQGNQNADGSYSKKSKAMARQVETYLKYAMPKGKVRTSSWSSPLRVHQIDYAAADAYAGLMLYHVMNEERKKMRPTPPHPAFAELGLSPRRIKKKYSDSKLHDTVMANADTEHASDAAEASGPDPASFNGPEAGRPPQDVDVEHKSAKEASEHLLEILSPSEPCLKGLTILFHGTFTCLNRGQLAVLVSRCGAQPMQGPIPRSHNMVSGNHKIASGNHLVVFGGDRAEPLSRKGRILFDRAIPAMAETDFYNMIRHRNRVDYPAMEKPASWEGKSLDTVLGELVEEIFKTRFSQRAYGSTPEAHVESACAWTIGAICYKERKPRTVIDLKDIDGGFFLYTLLKEHGHDLIQIIRAFDTPAPREDLPEQSLATETLS